jgi:DNA invertase Pin-like site-specific DNA recombinase
MPSKKLAAPKVYTEVMSGAHPERPVLSNLLANLRTGDVLVIWKLDRLGRSLKHLIEVVNELMTRKIGLKSLNDPIDTTTLQGRLIFNLFASLAEFERDVIRERTHAGPSAARARGRKGGRPKGVPSNAESTACAAETLYREGKLTAAPLRLCDSLHSLVRFFRYPAGFQEFIPKHAFTRYCGLTIDSLVKRDHGPSAEGPASFTPRDGGLS